MKPTRLSILTLAAICFGLADIAAADTIIGSGHDNSETRPVGGFHGVDLHGSGEVVVTQGDTEGLVIDAEDNLLPLIESNVGSDGILHLGFKSHAGSIESKKDVVYKLAAKTLDHLKVEGSGGIHTEALSTGTLKISLPGSGEVRVGRLKAATPGNVNLEGSGNVRLEGESPRLNLTIDGSGTCKANRLKTSAAEVQIDGSGDARVNASETLKVQINGSGEVGYRGDPKLTREINGSGEIYRDSKDE